MCFILSVYRQLIYNYPEQLFADAGVMAIEHADFDGIERLALVTGGEITSTFDNPELVKLGKCDLIEEVSFFLWYKQALCLPIFDVKRSQEIIALIPWIWLCHGSHIIKNLGIRLI